MVEVKHVYNTKLFLHDRKNNQNSGIFVEHMNNCYLLGANFYDNTRMMARFNNPILKRAQEERQLAQQNNTEEQRPPSRRMDPKSRRISLIGKTHTIVKGLYKGFTGQIVSITENKVRIELQAKGKTIAVPIDSLNIEVEEREKYTTNRSKSQPQSSRFNPF
jgi:transcription elongation factor